MPATTRSSQRVTRSAARSAARSTRSRSISGRVSLSPAPSRRRGLASRSNVRRHQAGSPEIDSKLPLPASEDAKVRLVELKEEEDKKNTDAIDRILLLEQAADSIFRGPTRAIDVPKLRLFISSTEDEKALEAFDALPTKTAKLSFISTFDFSPALTASAIIEFQSRTEVVDGYSVLSNAWDAKTRKDPVALRARAASKNLPEDVLRAIDRHRLYADCLRLLSPSEWTEILPPLGARLALKNFAVEEGLLPKPPTVSEPVTAGGSILRNIPQSNPSTESPGAILASDVAGDSLEVENKIRNFLGSHVTTPAERAAALQARLAATGQSESHPLPPTAASAPRLLPTDRRTDLRAISSLLRVEDPDAKVESAAAEREEVQALAYAHPESLNVVPSTVDSAGKLLQTAISWSTNLAQLRCLSRLQRILNVSASRGEFDEPQIGGLMAGYLVFIGLETVGQSPAVFEKYFQTSICGSSIAPLIRTRIRSAASTRSQLLLAKARVELVAKGKALSSLASAYWGQLRPVAPPRSDSLQPRHQPRLQSHQQLQLQPRDSPKWERNSPASRGSPDSVHSRRTYPQATPHPRGGAPPSQATVEAFAKSWDSLYRRGRPPTSSMCPHCLVYHNASRFPCFLYTAPAHRNDMGRNAFEKAGLGSPVSEWNSRPGRKDEHKVDPEGYLPDRAKKSLF